MIRHPFNIGFAWTLVYGLIALLLSVLCTQVVSRILLGNIDATLGITPDAGYQLTWSGLRPGSEEDADLDEFCPAAEAPPSLAALDAQLTRNSRSPKELMATVCGALRSYREKAARKDGVGKDQQLPMIGPMPEEVVQHVNVEQLGDCESSLSAPNDLGWFPVKCVLRRIRSLTPRDDLWGLVLMKDVAASGLQGNAYAFRWPRTQDSWKDPNSLNWKTIQPESAEQGMALTTLIQGLNRFDKLILPSIKTLEKEVWLERFLLRAFNNPFQFVILALGLWGAVLYLEMAFSTTRFGRNNPKALAEDVLAMAPMGRPAGGALTPPAGGLLPYGTELRNAADELGLQAQFNGKAVADTLSEWVPTLGFIGTVVGMIGAMDAVSGVVGADPGPELFAAMSEVTGQLSLAFYTTFIALLVGLALSLLRRWALARELRATIEAMRIVRAP